MPRKSRIDAAGALHHIIIRGIEGSEIFRDDHDRRAFIDRLGNILLNTQTGCLAWVLMSNHVHLLLQTGAEPISTVMRRLLTGYAQHFNRRYRRHGPLFQNRYKSILCEQDAYLLQLVRYIHLNPLRAGMVEDIEALRRYRYSGHSVLMGMSECEWQDDRSVLALFSEKMSQARLRYESFVAEGVQLGRQPELTGGGLLRSTGGWSALKAHRKSDTRIKGDERILGSSEFVERVITKSSDSYEKKTRFASRGIDMERLLASTARYYEIEGEDLGNRGKGRKTARARAVFCYLAVRKLQLSCVEVGMRLNLTPSAISKSAARGRAVVEEDRNEKALLSS